MERRLRTFGWDTYTFSDINLCLCGKFWYVISNENVTQQIYSKLKQISRKQSVLRNGTRNLKASAISSITSFYLALRTYKFLLICTCNCNTYTLLYYRFLYFSCFRSIIIRISFTYKKTWEIWDILQSWVLAIRCNIYTIQKFLFTL